MDSYHARIIAIMLNFVVRVDIIVFKLEWVTFDDAIESRLV